MNGRKRKVQIKFYVTEEERVLIEQKMKLVPTQNMAAYLRKIAIDGYIIQTDHSDIKAMTAEIQKIGVNINQIAKRVNSTGIIYKDDINDMKKQIEYFSKELWQIHSLLLNKTFGGD
ncbi:MobC family plasmid mobilization relaxosome protein [Clostridioides difficile]|uniref:MobC family plasmid mobilization relaxosome protein n=3 Tax=Clostridioides difficile TaxID=1496 RepID=UPI0021CDAA3F|nr:MobC family plasmid mobilization relaxosome protein [Clostridioides difficile]MCU6005231.1 plasmid mobilization relaxosome protein MobC [Clostridioides difficile]